MSTAAQGGEIMLFGVRVVVDSMRKSVSLNNLSQYEHHTLESSPSIEVVDAGNVVEKLPIGYASADEAVHPASTTTTNRERKRGVPWTEEEHKLFLVGLSKVGKGDWRGISRNFVKSRTPTQVASHAQKYFLRRTNVNRRRRRSSLFDITTDTVVANAMNDDKQEIKPERHPNVIVPQAQSAVVPMQVKSEVSTNMRFSVSPSPPMYYTEDTKPNVRSAPLDLNNDNNNNNNNVGSSLSLNLSLSMSTGVVDAASSRSSVYGQIMQGLGNGDSMIRVA